MLLTFANVERRLDPASQKPTAAQALPGSGSALALLSLYSSSARFAVRSAPVPLCLSVRLTWRGSVVGSFIVA